MATDAGVGLDALAHLEEQRDFLLRSLRDLERERAAGDIDVDDYQTLMDDYTARAAAVIRAIEEGEAAVAAARRSRGPAASRRRARTIAIATIAVVMFGVLAGILVAASSGERVAGQQVSGSITDGPTASDLNRAHLLDQQGKALDALVAYDAVLKADPKNTEALTYRGWLLARTAASAGASRDALLKRAQQSLDDAIMIDPSYPEAHVFRGIVLFRYLDQPAKAVVEFQLVLAGNPPADVRQLVEAELQKALAAQRP
jgi:tetratricopeptide (TPR) repeat protein